MKVLFIITNVNGFSDDTFSIGLASLMSYSASKGHLCDIKVVNTKEDYKTVFDMIDNFKPRVIGYTSVSSQFMFVKELSLKIKERYKNEIIQVCGGIHATIWPQVILEADGLDGVFVGEGEYAFGEFLDKIEKGLPCNEVENFAYNDNGRLVQNELRPLIDNLDDLPFPERDKYSYGKKFLNLKEGRAVFWFTRGCPYPCTYCCNHALAKTYSKKSFKVRYRSPDSCIKELREVVEKYNIKDVEIGDDTFGLDSEWTKEFCEKYASEIKVKFRAKLRVNQVNRELIELLKNAGCYHVYTSIESGNDYIRNKVMKRNMTKEQIIKAFSLYKEYGILAGASYIIGVPQDTEETIWDSVKFNRIIQPDGGGRANIFYPYKGTELGDYCFKQGLVDESAFLNFSAERKDSVLNFPPEYKKKLLYFQKNWRILSKPMGTAKAFFLNHFPRTAKTFLAVKKR